MSRLEPFRPRPWRVLLAFLVAPYIASVLPFVVAALTPIGFSPMPRFKPNVEDILFGPPFVALVGAYPITLILGVPLFFLLYGRVGFGPIPPILGGFAIVGTGVTAIVASTTTVDWDALTYTAKTALFGAFGGLVFWMIAVWRDPRRGPR